MAIAMAPPTRFHGGLPVVARQFHVVIGPRCRVGAETPHGRPEPLRSRVSPVSSPRLAVLILSADAASLEAPYAEGTAIIGAGGEEEPCNR
jgi:hypothetical protein